MRHWTRILTIVSAVSIVGACGTPKPPAPPPPPPPVAPATPPPAPPPTTQPPPQVDEYARIKAMSADEIDRMGLLAEIHFDYDKSDLREGDRSILNKDAEVLKKF